MDNGRTILVTGATDGLGREIAAALARKGFILLVHGRNPERGEEVASELRALGSNARFYRADFAKLGDVQAMADEILSREDRIDVLVNNAGIMESERKESADGHELAFQVNYLAPYLLTRRLLPLLERSAPSRIVNVASGAQTPIDFSDVMLERGWSQSRSYAQSKLAQIMMTVDMAAELGQRGITMNALHPATFMPTKMVVGRFAVQSEIEEGVDNVLQLVTEVDGVTGRYFENGRETKAESQAYDADALRSLRELSAELTGQ